MSCRVFDFLLDAFRIRVSTGRRAASDPRFRYYCSPCSAVVTRQEPFAGRPRLGLRREGPAGIGAADETVSGLGTPGEGAANTRNDTVEVVRVLPAFL